MANDQPDLLHQSPSDQSQFNLSIPIVVNNINSNQATLESIAVPEVSVEDQPARLVRLLTTAGKALLWIIQNPEWALKWALTILVIKLFLSEGFTLEALQKLQKPEIKLPTHQLPAQPAQSPL